MKQYLDLVKEVYAHGTDKGDRTGTGTKSVFGRQLRFDLQYRFPLVTTKFTSLKTIFTELKWFLNGDTNTKYLIDNDCKIWNEWATEDGSLGPVYGKQMRSWFTGKENVDQIAEVINLLKTKPDSRRLIVSMWNVSDLPNESISPQENVLNGKMALAPCHLLFQFYTTEMTLLEKINWFEKNHYDEYVKTPILIDIGLDTKINEKFKENNWPTRKLSCMLLQRSADTFLGVPYNIASYALLTTMIAKVCNMVPHEFIHTLGDAHIYSNHYTQVKELLTRAPYELPTLEIVGNVENIDDFEWENFKLSNYKYHPSIKAPIAI